MSRLFAFTAVLCLAAPIAAHAQLYTLDQMKAAGVAQCVEQHAGQPDGPRFCTCLVDRWVGLWSPEDIDTWTKTGQATPHMQQMESAAAKQCGG